MASPWKLLTRLVSRRRQQRQEQASTDEVKPELALTTLRPTETAADNGPNSVERPADETPVTHNQHEAVSANPDYSEEAASSVDDTVDIGGARLVEAADPAFSKDADTAPYDAPKPSPTDESATPKRSRRAKETEKVEVVSPPSPAVPTFFDDAICLDEEIRLLRERLARKLQLQNAQLKRMLERFEH
ncbi:hypothetical protein [Rhizobium leguminosarum]|uniref:hypothetical protein n=1 Tax=Rhizobium TaxID=379 RepID=UPI001C9436ED|nr:hypothetical protein [Rhizobium leguminosarum]MBY5392962.1 hypothetical protein [Rhizobium leguminosarum]MBY5434419.1 hypothetical protein [Rhizobium leguminosarum]